MTAFIKPSKSLIRCVGKAIGDYQMIQANDRLLLGLSGGKDSLSMLHLLAHFKQHAPIHFDFAAITVDPEIEGFDPSPLQAYLQALGVPHFYRKQPIMAEAMTRMKGDSFCAYCSRMKRGIMYTTARQEGYNVLVLAQHLDDLAESFMMSALFTGKLNTMKANYLNDAGDVRVIRPMVYVRERQTRAFAEIAQLPVISDNCPACFTKPMQRMKTKQLLAQQEAEHSHIFRNLLNAMRPLMGDFQPKTAKTNSPDTEDDLAEQQLAESCN